MATKAPSVVTLKHIAATLADKHELSKKQSNEVLTAFVDTLARHLKKGDKIRIPGLGIFVVARRAARRADQDQGEQESPLPRCQGSEGKHLTALAADAPDASAGATRGRCPPGRRPSCLWRPASRRRH
jgi:nucleoid DNA-binding protein